MERLTLLREPPSIDSLSRISAQRFDVPDPCWREIVGDDRRQSDTWFYECKRLKLPYLIVKVPRTYATLEWDCITVDADADESVRGENNGNFARELFAVFQQHCIAETGRPESSGSAFVGSVEHVLPETARVLADEFFDRLYHATRSRASKAA